MELTSPSGESHAPSHNFLIVHSGLSYTNGSGLKISFSRWRKKDAKETERKDMLYTLALILIIAWLLGMVSSYTLGGFIHILLVVAIIIILVRVIQGRKPL